MIKYWIKKLLWIIFAIGLLAVAVNMFMGPHNIAAGGLTGLAIILEAWLEVDRAIIVYIGNAIVIVAAFIFLGKEVGINTIIGAGLLPVAIDIVPRINLVEDRMLAMIVGSFIFGIAVSIMYKNKASSGGTAVPPLIMKKYFRLNTSIGLFISDGVIIVLTLFVFSVDSFFYAVFSILITSITMGYIESGFNKKKMVYIISEESKSITNDILTKINRGVTLIPVIGAYEGTEKQMLMVTLDTRNYRDLLAVVQERDKQAFMITDTVSDVHGRGFTYESGCV